MFNVHCLIDMFADLYYNRNFRDFSEIFENRPKNLISQFFFLEKIFHDVCVLPVLNVEI